MYICGCVYVCVCVCVCAACVLSHFSCVRLFVIPWTGGHQPSMSVGFSWQEYWSGLPFPPPRDRPNPGIKPESLKSSVLAGRLFTTSAIWESHLCVYVCLHMSVYTYIWVSLVAQKIKTLPAVQDCIHLNHLTADLKLTTL